MLVSRMHLSDSVLLHYECVAAVASFLLYSEYWILEGNLSMKQGTAYTLTKKDFER